MSLNFISLEALLFKHKITNTIHLNRYHARNIHPMTLSDNFSNKIWSFITDATLPISQREAYIYIASLLLSTFPICSLERNISNFASDKSIRNSNENVSITFISITFITLHYICVTLTKKLFRVRERAEIFLVALQAKHGEFEVLNKCKSV